MSASATATYLGFDYGSQRLGVAVGQSLTRSARPLITLACRAGQPDWAQVERLLGEWKPAALVVGVPRHEDGSASDSSEAAERFARRLAGRFGLPVHTVDERLSSHAAEQALGARARRDKASIDSLAAAVILETWLAEQP